MITDETKFSVQVAVYPSDDSCRSFKCTLLKVVFESDSAKHNIMDLPYINFQNTHLKIGGGGEAVPDATAAAAATTAAVGGVDADVLKYTLNVQT